MTNHLPRIDADPSYAQVVSRPFPVRPELVSLFRECTPRILVVTDGLTFDSAPFGLSDFINVLKNTTIHGMTPIVETAHTGTSPADHPRFVFKDTTLSKSKYDVLFLFGVSSAPSLAHEQVSVIAKFMQDGGGVFATGDHAELGRALCAEIPRVRGMRHWKTPDVPSASGVDRLTTNLPGADNVYQFEDQSDPIPQRLYPKYYASSDGIPANSRPHYILQHPTKHIIEVFPDHMHEGECVVPASLSGTMPDGDPEWPTTSGGATVSPELIGITMSAGGGFGGAQPVAPRSFGAIGAYDGHPADVGRVTTDSTWHHFININLVATSDGPGLAATPDVLERVHTYFRNQAEWLMPRNTRRCLRWPLFWHALEFLPVREILPSLPKSPLEDVRVAVDLGNELVASLRNHLHPAAIEELEDDVLAIHSEEFAHQIRSRPDESFTQQLGRRLVPRSFLGRAAVGTAAAVVAHTLPLGEDAAAKFKSVGGIGGIETNVKAALARNLKEASGIIRHAKSHLDRVCDLL